MSNKNIFYFFIFISIFHIIFSFKYPINNKLIDAELGSVTSVEISSKKDFDQYIMNNKYVISIFHADWCGHCKRFLPVFDEASKYKIINKEWKFLKVPCSKYNSICEAFSINGYPTIKTFKDSKEIKIRPPRDIESFLEYLIKISSEPLIEIENNNIDKFYKEYGTFSPLIEYNSKDQSFISCIKDLANKKFLSEYYFGLLKNEEEKDGKITFDFDNNSLVYKWNKNCNDVKTFLNNNIFPLVSYINIAFMRKMNKYNRRVFMLFYNSNNEKANNFIDNTYKNISKDNRQIVFGYVISNKDKDLSNYFKINLTKETEIQILIYDFDKEITYKHPFAYDSNILKDGELENNIRELVENINSLPFTSGSKFTDFFRKIGVADLSYNTKMILIVGIFVVLIVIVVYLLICCDSEDIDEEIDIKDEKLIKKIRKMENKEKKEIKEINKDKKDEENNLNQKENDKKLKKD